MLLIYNCTKIRTIQLLFVAFTCGIYCIIIVYVYM